MRNSIVQKNVSDEELAFCYSRARVFVFPSKYEGFGIPILEAMGNRCPVILSNSSCFPEIAGDAALYFDADNPKELYEQIMSVISSDGMSADLAEKGYIKSKEFSWKKTATQTYRIYRFGVKKRG